MDNCVKEDSPQNNSAVDSMEAVKVNGTTESAEEERYDIEEGKKRKLEEVEHSNDVNGTETDSVPEKRIRVDASPTRNGDGKTEEVHSEPDEISKEKPKEDASVEESVCESETPANESELKSVDENSANSSDSGKETEKMEVESNSADNTEDVEKVEDTTESNILSSTNEPICPEDSKGDSPVSAEQSGVEKESDPVVNADKDVGSPEREECDGQSDSGSVPSVIKSTASEDTSKECSNGKAGDSDKENAVDGPMDLSKAIDLSKPCKTINTEKVDALSDEEAEPCAVNLKELDPEQLMEKNRLVKSLQEELRNEEAKLVLLKKLRQSQMMQHLQENNSQQVSSQDRSGKSSAQRQDQSAPPPLIRRGQGGTLSKEQGVPPQLQRGGQSSHIGRSHSSNQGPPPLVMAPRQSSQNSRGNHVSSSSTPPNLIQGYRHQQVSQSQQQEQTPAQRQAAAKLALRKQLEKTLLQIPPPKPPPPEMNFIPGLTGNEFICLVGLEEVVKNITDADAKAKGDSVSEVKYVFNPFVCVQCGTDFTPVWKRDKPGSKSVICEQCVTSNQKKALKQEHTNRLKSAFVKALQQEQEIEQRMQSQSSSSSAPSAPSPTATSSAQISTPQNSIPSLTIPAAMTLANSSYASPVNLSTTSFKPTQEQIRQHQNLIHAHQTRLGAAHLGLQALHPRLAFPFQATTMSSKTAHDLQRQYLLDMINPGRASQGTILWKS